MLDSIFMLYGIADIQCYLQRQPTFDIAFLLVSVKANIKRFLRSILLTFMSSLMNLYFRILIFKGEGSIAKNYVSSSFLPLHLN